MENMQCPAEDVAILASVARDICPFPDYNPSPLFVDMLSINSSLHLRNHYREVQSSLTPKQLEDFTQGLRTTFGRQGKVTLGGVGVVALSLAVLFDTLARQIRGEWVSDSGPIPGLFLKNMRGYYPPQVHTVSEYLRLVPYIANNPSRMVEESEKYLKKLIIQGRHLEKLGENHTMNEDITAVNEMVGSYFAGCLYLHLRRINNATVEELVISNRSRSPDVNFFHLNCDPEMADRQFLAELQKSENRIREAFNRCKPNHERKAKTWLLYVAQLQWLDVFTLPLYAFGYESPESMIAHREDFDLKADALGKWT
ncbi:uncharacterized protein LOC131981074 [Centropristis striata]|uniref:uncharacterized protein LOC131981074 n=1 Tax=Centropristis striata TaxID=184440 RepID=UPI0027E0EFD9|nr:uncharacterized protein LOC131981074 [Centropristis striata]